MDWNKVKSPTFIVSVIFAFKLILQPFNIVIPDETLNAFANGICALITIAGIFMDHAPKAKPVEQQPAQEGSAPV